MKSYAIIGFGCAGYHAAKAIRKNDPDGKIVVYSDTADPPFNPMLSTYYASDMLSLEGTFPFGSMDEIVKDLQLELRSETKAAHVDAARREIELADGKREPFDSILVATGASAIVPASLTENAGRYFLMRTLEDAQNLRNYIEKENVKTAVVIGASMAGIKTAEIFYRKGIPTTLIDGASGLFPLAAYPDVAEMIQEKLNDLGIKQIYDAQVAAIRPNTVELSDGRTLEADCICLCIGVHANIQLVANTKAVEGTEVKIGKGIIVDEQMQTNVPGIFAAGDCCEGKNLQTGETSVIGLWANASAQGECAGKNMAGKTAFYYGNILHNITHFMDMDFISLGDITLPGEHRCFAGKDFFVEVCMDADQLNSMNIFGQYRISGILKSHLTKRLLHGDDNLTPAQKGMLLAEGLPAELINLLGDKKS